MCLNFKWGFLTHDENDVHKAVQKYVRLKLVKEVSTTKMTVHDHHLENNNNNHNHQKQHAERSCIISYLKSAIEMRNKLQQEIERLEKIFDYDAEAYGKYKMKIGARNSMEQHIRDAEEALRTL